MFISRPPNPSTVVEGQNLTLQWSYNLDGQANILTRMINVTRGVSATIVSKIQNNNVIVSAGYEDQFAASISDTQATITILTVPRSINQEIYRLFILTGAIDSIQSDVEIGVLCKYNTKKDRY